MHFDKIELEKIIKSIDQHSFNKHRALFCDFVPDIDSKTLESSMNKGADKSFLRKSRMKSLVWKKPDSGINAIRYIIMDGTLMVSGDLGEAIYCWSSPIDWGFLANNNHDYFCSKAMGIEGHSRPGTWDPKRLAWYMENYLAEKTQQRIEEAGVEKGGDPPTFDTTIEEHLKVEWWRSNIESEHEWTEFIRDNENLIEHEAWDWGKGLSFRTVAHWHGIRCAIKQIKDGVKDEDPVGEKPQVVAS